MDLVTPLLKTPPQANTHTMATIRDEGYVNELECSDLFTMYTNHQVVDLKYTQVLC